MCHLTLDAAVLDVKERDEVSFSETHSGRRPLLNDAPRSQITVGTGSSDRSSRLNKIFSIFNEAFLEKNRQEKAFSRNREAAKSRLRKDEP